MFKAEWRSESLGWFDERTGEMVGAGLVLYPPAAQDQALPRLPPRGSGHQLVRAEPRRVAAADARAPQAAGRLLREDGPAGDHPALGGHLHQGRHPEPGREAPARHQGDFIEPRAFEVADKLRRMGWQQGEDGGAGFGDVQPRYVFQVPLANRSLEEVHKNFNQLWQHNIKKAEKEGVEVVQGGYHDLEEWQRL